MNSYTAFAVAALERAVKTFAQTLAALLVADGLGVVGTAWGDRLNVAGMAAIVSILTSVASAPFGGSGPSLGPEATTPPAKDPAKDAGYSLVELCIAVLVIVILILVLARLA